MLAPVQPVAPEKRKFVFKNLEKSTKSGLPWPCSGLLQFSQTQQLSSRGAASLCEVCKGITLSALESPDGYTYAGKTLERSASLPNACRLCTLISNTLKHAYIRMVQDVNLNIKMNDQQAERAFSKILNANGQFVSLFAFADSDIALIPKPPFLESDGGFPPVLTLYNPSGSPSTGLTEYFVPCSTMIEAVALAAHWLSECFATHPKCPKTILSPLPKRLVDVGCLGDADDLVRLWLNPSLTNEEESYKGPYGRYVALTYCWGTRAFTTLTPESQASMVRGIDVAKIPQTIRDAIRITRLLGIRYLWVDSLCIFQGTSAQARRDWTEQSQQMANVYKNATLTIGSDTAEDAYQGFEYADGSINESLALLPSTWSSLKTNNPMFIGPDGVQAGVPFPKLHTRGWTFQERLLSTRYFTFGSEGMFWECTQVRQYDNACLWHSYEELSQKLPESPTFDDWHFLLGEYSDKQLTKSEDRLVALAGLRAHFLRLRGVQDTDLAGLWRSNLSWDLLWDLRFGCRNDSISMAPSWSWTSTCSPVSWSFAGCWRTEHVCHSECASIVDATAKSHSIGPTFKIEGRIKLSGFVSKAKSITGDPREFTNIAIVDELENTVYADFDGGSSYLTKLRLTSEVGNVASSIFCVQLHNNPGCIGLLAEATDGTCTEFRRIGIYQTKDPMTSRPTKPVVVVIV
ncbi:heterokaryon incompatibility protein-domain-containing protein [Macrophomina phaseolina]|uniref:Heterokaryon incompatibility protein-domain-containing protein n=1 Tax=Macrophomina phaseolina TaxID=35725 RepID=A0ABQ8GVP1_9PEZI|nr:heterokaryon incompatibility protein-domain-containing protein [Macrophomina phaseolina]